MLHQILMPNEWRSAIVFASPHSGRVYTPEFLGSSCLDSTAIRSSEDAYVDELLTGVTSFGSAFLQAHAPRAFVDMNRAATELDPAVIAGVPRSRHNLRVAAGLGVIPRVVAARRSIYARKLPLSEAHARINGLWQPYHSDLRSLLLTARARFGWSILVDVHSMPSEARNAGNETRADIVLGDRYGSAAFGDVTGAVQSAFERAGFSVSRNVPFSGAYITKTYGQPHRNVHCVQVEIDRGLYLDEARIAKLHGFEAFKRRLDEVWKEIADFGAWGVDRFAAE